MSDNSSRKKAKILFLDIETAPSLGWVWAKWQTNVIDFKQDWYMLSYAYKWATDKKVTTVGLPDFAGYNPKGEPNDWKLLLALRALLDEADIVIAHNGDGFDLPKINTRMITHRIPPPSPYRTVDTLRISRKVFQFDSNKLDDLGRYLKIGRKLPHTGFHLWKGCMDGDKASWDLMKKYNGHDVELLEEVYKLMRTWDPNHPRVNFERTTDEACPACGSLNVQNRGFQVTALRKKQRYQCQDCSKWYLGSAKGAKSKR